MNTTDELQYHGLNMPSVLSHLTEEIKKLDGHGHPPDWQNMIALADAAIDAIGCFVAFAQNQIERAAQPALDFGDMLPGDVAECAMCDTAGVGRLSNVTIGPVP